MRPYRVGGLLSFCATLCACITSPCQSADPSATPAASKYAAEPYVIQCSEDVITMRADGTGERFLTNTIAVQSEAALRDLSVLTILFSSKSESAEFSYVRVVHADGTVQETPVSSAMEQPAPVTQQAPFYSDLQTKQIPVRSMRVGDRLEWQAKFIQTVADAPNQFWYQSTFATTGIRLDDNVELRVPSGLHLTVWTNPRAHAEFTESNQNGQHIYHWHHANLDPTVGPEAEAAKKKEEKRLRTADEELDETKGGLPSLGWTTLPDWSAVGAWYRGLLTDRLTPDEAIKAKVTELTAGKATQLEKAQAIYTWVSTHIRYIGIDFGIGRFQPHSAAEVFANQFGDCKDKHVLLASMLSLIGVQADPVLIGANVRFNSALPAPLSFNHLITRATVDGKPVYLDATAEIGVWAALLQPLRDHEALIVPASGPAVVAQTPADLPFPQVSTFNVVGSLDNDLTSDSSMTLTLRGDAELVFRPIFRSISPANYGELVQRLMASMGFGGTTSDPSFENVDDPTKPLTVTFHYHRVKEKDWGENRITATFLNIALPYFTDEQPATSAIQIGAPRTETSTVELTLPKGWSASPPEDIHAHASFAQCDVIYHHKDDKLFEQRRLTVLKPEVPVKDVKQYLAWYDECGAGSYPYIQLSPAPKVSASAIAPQPVLPGTDSSAASNKPSDPKAATLVQQAFQRIRANDLDAARQSLDQAAAINATEPYLWSGYAAVAQMLGMSTRVLDDLKKELTYHPGEMPVYQILAQVQFAARDTEGAFTTLRNWVKVAPDDGDAPLALGRALAGSGQNAEALTVAQTAIDRLGANGSRIVELRILAATADAELGHATEAAKKIAPLLDTVTTPSLLNDIAYVLAEGGFRLPDAEAAQSRVLASMEADTSGWKPTDELSPIRARQTSLSAAWDTMAWILYHQGKLQEALAYSDAARHATDSKVNREHFTAIAQAAHIPATSTAARKSDQELRTFPLGSSHGQNGVAPFVLLLSDGKIIDGTPDKSPTSTTTTLPHPEQYLKSADLHALFPPGSKVHLVRSGMVNCHQNTCELILAPI